MQHRTARQRVALAGSLGCLGKKQGVPPVLRAH